MNIEFRADPSVMCSVEQAIRSPLSISIHWEWTTFLVCRIKYLLLGLRLHNLTSCQPVVSLHFLLNDKRFNLYFEQLLIIFGISCQLSVIFDCCCMFLDF